MAKTKLSLMRCEVCGGEGAEIMTDFDGAGQVDGRHVECKHCGAELDDGLPYFIGSNYEK